MNDKRSTSYGGGDNFRLAQQMSVMVKDGQVPDFDAVLYAMQASEDAGDYQPIPYADHRGA
jgi:hypothetical protein